MLGFPVAPSAVREPSSPSLLGGLLSRLVGSPSPDDPPPPAHLAAWHTALGLPPPAPAPPPHAAHDSGGGCAGPSLLREAATCLPRPLDVRKIQPLLLSSRGGGVPPNLRGRVWFALLEASLGDESEHPGLRAVLRDPSYFGALLRRRGRATHAAVRRLIRTDARRTFGTHRHARRLQGSIARVLDAYSHRNPALGYCQSMNFLAGTLLLHLPEEAAFLALCVLLERVLPAGMHAPMLQGLTAELRLLSDVLSRTDGPLLAHMQRHGIAHDACASRWLMTCLVSVGLPWAHTLRFWDMLLCDAALKSRASTPHLRRAPSSVPLVGCAALLAQAAPRLLATADPEALVTALLAIPAELTAAQLESVLHDVARFVAANGSGGGGDRLVGLAVPPLREQHRRIVEAETLLREEDEQERALLLERGPSPADHVDHALDEVARALTHSAAIS